MKGNIKLNTVRDAISLVKKLGAKDRLLTHIKLVGEAAEIIIALLKKLGLNINENLVRIGIVAHDAGKIVHPDELDQPGDQHGQAGFELLLKNDVQPEIARFCLSHARWRETECSFEELLVALADNLWKGKR
jgi:predicted hydrolase (HD superfamily)